LRPDTVPNHKNPVWSLKMEVTWLLESPRLMSIWVNGYWPDCAYSNNSRQDNTKRRPVFLTIRFLIIQSVNSSSSHRKCKQKRACKRKPLIREKTYRCYSLNQVFGHEVAQPAAEGIAYRQAFLLRNLFGKADFAAA